MKAPGTENSATFLPAKYSPLWTFAGPASVALTRVTSGILSPFEIVMMRGPLARPALQIVARRALATGIAQRPNAVNFASPSILKNR